MQIDWWTNVIASTWQIHRQHPSRAAQVNSIFIFARQISRTFQQNGKFEIFLNFVSTAAVLCKAAPHCETDCLSSLCEQIFNLVTILAPHKLYRLTIDLKWCLIRREQNSTLEPKERKRKTATEKVPTNNKYARWLWLGYYFHFIPSMR